MSASFLVRHLGPDPEDQLRMLAELGLGSLDQLAAEVVPADILLTADEANVGLPPPCPEAVALA